MLALTSFAAHGDQISEFHYTITRDGETIGNHLVTVTPEGPSTTVEAKTELEVTFGPLTLYKLQHLRQETSRDGELEAMTAFTNKNGDVYEIAITREPQGYRRVVNGRSETFDDSVKVLALWHEDLFKYSSFLSPMEDRTYRITVDYVGSDKLDLLDRTIESFHYRISGDTNRELWFDNVGRILKVRLLDHDTEIEYILNAMSESARKLADEEAMTTEAERAKTRLAARR